MPHTETYTQQKEKTEPSFTLMDIIAYARPSTGGLAMFMTKTILTSTTMATVGGIAATMMFAPLVGPVVPFLVGSTVGFLGGIAQRWVFDIQECRQVMREFPSLMDFHLKQLPQPVWIRNVSTANFDEWKRDFDVNVNKRGMAILALYGASTSISVIRRRQEDALVEKVCAGEEQTTTE